MTATRQRGKLGCLPESIFCPDCGKFKGDRTNTTKGPCRICKAMNTWGYAGSYEVTPEEMKAHRDRMYKEASSRLAAERTIRKANEFLRSRL